MTGQSALTLALAVVLGVGIPWLSMRMLLPTLTGEGVRTVSNYRGRPVAYGLGVVWFVWAGCATVAGVALSGLLGTASVLAVLTVAGPVALVAFGAGLVDDAYGSGASKGFRGHLKALARGRLTTGGLKVLAIGTASLVASLSMASAANWGTGSVWSVAAVPGVLVAGAAIALTANLLNLTDLRPGRALKAYVLLAACGVLSTGLLFASTVVGVELPQGSGRLIDLVALGVFVLGPVAAVWRYDLGEVAMLGDAGANPMGVVAGLLIVLGLPFWALIAYAAAVFALNLVSERVSFSRVIESNSVLSRVDRMGRRDM